MNPADILKKNYPPSILLFGPPGGGKTGLISQLSGGYVFDFDRGMRTAATLKDKFFTVRATVDFDVYRDANPRQPKAYSGAMKKITEIVELTGKEKWRYDACGVDSLTGLCQAAQLHIQGLGDKSNPLRDPLAKMEIQNWGSLVNEVERFLLLLRSLKVLTIVTAHVDILEKKVGGKLGELEITDMFPSSATKKHGMQKLMWLFDEVLYTDVKPVGGGKMNYRVSGIPTRVIKARTRSGIGLVVHNETGLRGLLEKMGYHYPPTKEKGAEE